MREKFRKILGELGKKELTKEQKQELRDLIKKMRKDLKWKMM